MKKRTLAFILCTIMCLGATARSGYKLQSPDKKLQINLFQSPDGELRYTFQADRKIVIDDSPLGFIGLSPAKIEEVERLRVDTLWHPLWGKRAEVKDRYNAMTLRIGELKLSLRLYNDGLAFRYTALHDLPLMSAENTGYNFAGDYRAWFYNGENHNLGPLKLSACEGRYHPVMTVEADPNHYLALHEAALEQGVPLVLQSDKGKNSFSVAQNGRTLKKGQRTAWRVILYGKTPGVLVDSHLIELLNPDPAPQYDFSWVKPGVAVWDWRIDGAVAGDFTYSMSLPSWLRMVDFAAQQGFKHLVLDANWYGPEFAGESDPVKGEKATDVRKLLEYAREKGVGVWLYLNDVAGRKYPIEQTLKQYGDWGATGVKYGFMNGTPEQKNLWTRRVTELCAQNRLLVDFHDGPVHPYGQMRTWPNAVAREFCHAQLDAHRVFQPKTFVTTVFVNMVAGPIDMNNGMFDLRQGNTTRVDESQPVPSTLVSEAARTLITFSGATILPDIPEFYKKYPDLLHFISAQKMPWKESRTLDGQIGEYIVMMRRSSDDLFLVGAATDEQARQLTIPLSFLPKGTYELLVTEDGPGAHYLTNRETCVSRTLTVKPSDGITVQLAPGGGACLMLRKMK